MESTIDKAWNSLYHNNSKFQAFAVSTDSTVIWQTSNWNLVGEIEQIRDSLRTGSHITLGDTEYSTVIDDENRYAGTAGDKKGHLMMAQVIGDTWVIAWVDGSAVPALAIIDLEMTALALKGIM